MANTGTAILDFGDNIAVGTAGVDPLWRATTTLISCDSTTADVDNLGALWSPTGLSVDAANKVYGASSLGGSGYVFNTAANICPMPVHKDFTLEWWFRGATSYPAGTVYLVQYAPGEFYGFPLQIACSSTGALTFFPGSYSASSIPLGVTITLGAWYHLCIQSRDGVMTVFITGYPIYSGPNLTNSDVFKPGSGPLMQVGVVSGAFGTMNIDDMRISNVARYPGKGFAPTQCGRKPVSGSQRASVTITGQTGILAGSPCEAWLSATDSADHSDYEHRFAPIALRCGPPTAGAGFTIFGTSPVMLRGKWNVNWVWA